MTMKTPFPTTPDFSPVVKLMTLQTRFAIEASQGMMKLAMLPWQIGVGITPAPQTIKAVEPKVVKPTPAPVQKATPKVAQPVVSKPTVKPVVKAEPAPTAQVAKVATPAPALQAPVQAAVAVKAPVAAQPAAAKPAPVKADSVKPVVKPVVAQKVQSDDLTALKGVGPKLAKALNDVGVTGYGQIAAWSDADIARIESQVAMAKGRVAKNGWVAQATRLSKVKA